MMTLLQAWADSLTLLKPKNLKLFIMVTLKSIVEAYKLMFKYFWWLLLLIVLCCNLLPFNKVFNNAFGASRVVVALFFLSQLFVFMICTIMHSSIEKKDCDYFRSQMPSFIYFVIPLFFVPVLSWVNPLHMYMIFTILFFLDSEKDLKSLFISLWYALKMILFNLPLLLCVYVIMWLSCLTVMFVAAAIVMLFIVPDSRTLVMRSLSPVVVLPWMICVYSNLYIKFHDQFDLYYKQPQEYEAAQIEV